MKPKNYPKKQHRNMEEQAANASLTNCFSSHEMPTPEKATIDFPNYLMSEQMPQRRRSLFNKPETDDTRNHELAEPAIQSSDHMSARAVRSKAQSTFDQRTELVDAPKKEQTIHSEKPSKPHITARRRKQQPASDLPVNKISYPISEDERLAELTRMQEWFIDEPNDTFSATAQKTVFDEQTFQQKTVSFDSQQAHKEALLRKRQQNLIKEWRDHIHYAKNRPFNPTYLPSSQKVKGSAGQKDPTNYQAIKQTLLQAHQDLLLFEAKEESLLDLATMEQLAHAKPKPTSAILEKTHPREKQTAYRYPQSQTEKLVSPKMVVQQEALLQDLPDEPSMEPLAQLNPLPGKQRRAMNRSLSWIMKQENESEFDATPYAKSKFKQRTEQRNSIHPSELKKGRTDE